MKVNIMTKILIFDTETTDIIKKGSSLVNCPRLLQIAWQVYSLECDTFTLRSQFESLVCPPNNVVWEVAPGAYKAHGISKAEVLAYGLPSKQTAGLFNYVMNCCDVVVAHNLDFDRRVIQAFWGRHNLPDIFKLKQLYCTMKTLTNELKLPGRYGFKWPNLQEAHRWATGHDFVGAHNALTDVKACAEVLKASYKNNLFTPQEQEQTDGKT